MRIRADLRSLFAGDPGIVQVQKTPPTGAAGQEPVNGQYVIPMPGGSFSVDETDYILNGVGEIDGGDVISEAFANLLSRYPDFNDVYFNPLITGDHVTELDLSGTFPDTSVTPTQTLSSRVQIGRGGGSPLGDGMAPNNVALLAQNETVSPVRPGLVVTDTIDVSAFATGGEAHSFLVWWKLYGFTVSDDINSEHGATAGVNTPAIRYITEVDQEPSTLEVYLSADSGTTWTQVGRLSPATTLCDATETVKLAFVNRGSEKIYLTSYAVLF